MDENGFFRQATLRISSSLNIETAMDRCMTYLKQYLPVSGMLFGLYDPKLHIGKVLASIWPDHLQRPSSTVSFPREFWAWMEDQWSKDPGIRIFNDVNEEEPPFRQIFTSFWPENISHLSMDLELEEKRLGVFHLFAEGKHRYSQSHADLISLLHEPMAIAISNILQHQEILRLKEMLADDNRYLHRQMLKMTGDTIIGADFGLKNVMEMVRQVAPLNSPVLIMGETGVGKEVIANAIHGASLRNANPYITVNCGAIPENLMDSELFGHEKGAFTGAISRKRGRFERAHTGTIFLDEIGELTPAAQIRLLRVLQQHEIERVGGTETIDVDVRIISATHRNLEEMVAAGTFREDLWFRLNVYPIIIPPLRQRKDDIPALVSHFIDLKSKELKIRHVPSLTSDDMEMLQDYRWPGNVRELENLVERAMIQSQIPGHENRIRFDGLGSEIKENAPQPTVMCHNRIETLNAVIASHIHRALARSGGRVEGPGGASQMLGIHPSTLRGKMKKLGIPYGRKGHSSA